MALNQPSQTEIPTTPRQLQAQAIKQSGPPQPIKRGWIGILASGPKAGKTHLALTASRDSKVYLFDTENGSEFIIENRFKEHQGNITAFQVRNWEGFAAGLKQITIGQNGRPNNLTGNVIIIDSCTDLINMLDHFVKEERKGTKEPYFAHYGHINRKMLDTFNYIVDKTGASLLLTSHMKKVFDNDGNETGKETISLKEKVIHLASFAGIFDKEIDNWNFEISRWKPRKQHWVIDTDPYSGTINEIVRDLKFPTILPDDAVPSDKYGFHLNPNHR